MTSTVKARLAALEKRAAVARPSTSEPYWSEPHGCMMTDHGGFILPVVLPPEECEAAAQQQPSMLTHAERTL